MAKLQLEAPVAALTVYPGQARVVRRGRVILPEPGTTDLAGPVTPTEVLLRDLPLTLVHESVRVTGRGAGAITGIDVRTAHRATDESARTASLLTERQRLVIAAQEITDRRRALDLRVTMLESVAQAAGKPYARQLAAGGSPDELGPLTERLATQLTEVLAARRTLLDQEKELTDQRDRVERELASTGSPTPDRTEVAIAVDPGAGGELELEVSYLVEGATWEPRYDIRLDEGGGDVDVTWFGMVRQWSGEDWPACELRLSTARPTAAITIPELDPWFLSERTPIRPVPGSVRGVVPAAMVMAADMSRSAGREEHAEPISHAAATMEVGLTAATYAIKHPVAVPADGSDHQALITTFRLPAEVDHVTAPVSSDDVFLRATVANSSPHTLRAGRASLFHGAEFVGVSDLDVLAPGEVVELALGLDDRIRVDRELVARHADRAFLGASARHEARWRTTVANHTGRSTKITVIDQAPVSRAPGITVRDVKTAPEARVDDMGEVTWRLELPDGEERRLELTVRVEVARGVVLDGWRE